LGTAQVGTKELMKQVHGRGRQSKKSPDEYGETALLMAKWNSKLPIFFTARGEKLGPGVHGGRAK